MRQRIVGVGDRGSGSGTHGLGLGGSGGGDRNIDRTSSSGSATPGRKATPRKSSITTPGRKHSWEISSDDLGSSTSSTVTSPAAPVSGGTGTSGSASSGLNANLVIPNPVIPMYNPLQYASYKKDYNVPEAPGSLPMSWQFLQDDHHQRLQQQQQQQQQQLQQQHRFQLSMLDSFHHQHSHLQLHQHQQLNTVHGDPEHPNLRNRHHTISMGIIPAAPNSMTGLRTSQLPSLTPGFVPDSKYHAYLLGQHQPWNGKNNMKTPYYALSSKQKQKSSSSPLSKICFAKFCIVFSWIAVMFLVFIGILLDRQPLYIPHVLPKHVQYTANDRKPKTFYTVLLSERLIPASNAYKAAWWYFLTGCFCYAYINNFWGYSYLLNTRNRRRRLYQDIPDADSTVPSIHHPFEDGLPAYVSYSGTSPVMRAYQYNNRLSRRLWETISLTMHRIGIYLATVWPRYQERRARRKYTGAKDI